MGISMASIPRSVVGDVCSKDDEAIKSMDALDIDPEDRKKFEHIIDADHSGTISVFEFLSGLTRLRGIPRRSDLVSLEFCLMDVQEKIRNVSGVVHGMAESLESA